MSFNIVRYLAFEINRTCPNYELHRGKCPISHPDRYKYSTSLNPITDGEIIQFWEWSRTKGFRGIILWHMYNEPVIFLDRIKSLMRIMKKRDPFQPFQLTTGIKGKYPDFDIVKISDYDNGAELDNRIETVVGDGKPYSEMPKHGLCGRGKGFEIQIDYFGNWCLCCGDWTCEEAIGNIHNENWNVLYKKWDIKRMTIQWNDEESYNALPRLCRSCLDKNTLSWKGGI